MRVTIVADELPYPPVHGGKLDLWRQLEALSSAGVQLQLVCWYHVPTESDQLAERVAAVRALAEDVIPITLPEGHRARTLKLARLVRYPFNVAVQVVSGRLARTIAAQVRGFAPDLVLLQRIYGGALAAGLARGLDVPLVVRPHNVEHQYMALQARVAQHWRERLHARLTRLHLARYETSLLRQCDHFFDISLDDLEHWRAQGLTNGSWLPPFAGLRRPGMDASDDLVDLVFLGNLHTPNNVAGVIWLLREILPRVRRVRPDVTCLVAGSRPVPIIRDLCAQSNGVTLLADPPDAARVYERGRVLLNPVREGGGVNVKSVEMLSTSRPIVTTPQGVRGLPTDVAGLFEVAAEGEQFAEAIARKLERPEANVPEREMLVDRYFGRSAVARFVADLQRISAQNRTDAGSQRA